MLHSPLEGPVHLNVHLYIKHISDENLIDIKVWLKSNFEPWEKVKAKWKITSEKRIQLFHRKQATDLTSTLNDWPTLTKYRGYECVI